MKKSILSIVSLLVASAIFMPCTFISASAAEFTSGDVDGDGMLSASDSLAILRYSVWLENFTDAQKRAADINGDGKIDSLDALFTLRSSVGIPDGEPIEEENLEDQYRYTILNFINAERAKVNARPLELDDRLCEVAVTRTDEISRPNCFAHTRPDGRPWDTILDENRIDWRRNGESIAACKSAERACELWINSPGHRQNMLNPEYGKIGIGHVYNENSAYGNYWVTDFTN